MNNGVILHELIESIPDFPKPGILFRDMSPLLANPFAFGMVIDLMQSRWKHAGVTKIGAFDARGFIFAGALAKEMTLPFFMIRKKGKLPGKTVRKEYGLEYGRDSLEIKEGVVQKDDRVLFVDDLLATGGTAHAGKELIESFGASVVGLSTLMELGELGGRELFAGEVYALLTYGKTIEMTDVIARYESKIVLIERLHYPSGSASAGGHVDPGENAEEAAGREFTEETGLVLTGKKFFMEKSGAWRDPRYESSHSCVFTGEAHGEIRDEKHLTKVVLMSPEEILAMPDEKFAFDHAMVLKKFILNR